MNSEIATLSAGAERRGAGPWTAPPAVPAAIRSCAGLRATPGPSGWGATVIRQEAARAPSAHERLEALGWEDCASAAAAAAAEAWIPWTIARTLPLSPLLTPNPTFPAGWAFVPRVESGSIVHFAPACDPAGLAAHPTRAGRIAAAVAPWVRGRCPSHPAPSGPEPARAWHARLNLRLARQIGGHWRDSEEFFRWRGSAADPVAALAAAGVAALLALALRPSTRPTAIDDIFLSEALDAPGWTANHRLVDLTAETGGRATRQLALNTLTELLDHSAGHWDPPA